MHPGPRFRVVALLHLGRLNHGLKTLQARFPLTGIELLNQQVDVRHVEPIHPTWNFKILSQSFVQPEWQVGNDRVQVAASVDITNKNNGTLIEYDDSSVFIRGVVFDSITDILVTFG